MGDDFGELGRRVGNGDDAVTDSRRPVDLGLLAGAMVGCQQPGDAAAAVELLRSRREHGHGIQSEMPPFVAVGLAGAQAFADFDHFLEPAGAAGGVDPGGGPFAPLLGVERAANPGADNQTAAGNQVNGRHSLGHQDGMAQGGQ